MPEAPVDQPDVVADDQSKVTEVRGASGGADGGDGDPGGGGGDAMQDAVLRLWTCKQQDGTLNSRLGRLAWWE